jgi:hypothetical protein
MEMHDPVLFKQPVLIAIDACAIVPFGGTFAAPDALHELVKFFIESVVACNIGKVVPVLGVDGLGLLLDAGQPEAKRRNLTAHLVPKRNLCISSRLISPRLRSPV